MAGAYKPEGAKKYVGWYYDAARVRRKFTGTGDKATTVAVAEKRERDAMLEREGLVTPLDRKRKEAAAVPIADHVAEYRASLLTKGCKAKHVSHVGSTLLRLFGDGGVRLIGDLSAESIERGLAAVRSRGRAARTHNHARNAAKAFAEWAWERGKVADPIRGLDALGLLNEEADRRLVRRALKPDELVRLILAAEMGGPHKLSRRGYQYEYREITGRDRAMLYRIALGTGYRANEIRQLTPEDFDLGETPTVTAMADETKNGRESRQPIPAVLAELIRPWLPGRPAEKPVLDVPEKTAKMLRKDLAAAGIPEVDARGRVVDFHALRTTYITDLARRGVHPAVAQKLARHSDINLTMKAYTDLDDELRAALEKSRPTGSGSGR